MLASVIVSVQWPIGGCSSNILITSSMFKTPIPKIPCMPKCISLMWSPGSSIPFLCVLGGTKYQLGTLVLIANCIEDDSGEMTKSAWILGTYTMHHPFLASYNAADMLPTSRNFDELPRSAYLFHWHSKTEVPNNNVHLKCNVPN